MHLYIYINISIFSYLSIYAGIFTYFAFLFC